MGGKIVAKTVATATRDSPPNHIDRPPPCTHTHTYICIHTHTHTHLKLVQVLEHGLVEFDEVTGFNHHMTMECKVHHRGDQCAGIEITHEEHMHTHTRMHAHTHARTHACTHTRMHAHAHTHSHPHTHTHTHRHTPTPTHTSVDLWVSAA